MTVEIRMKNTSMRYILNKYFSRYSIIYCTAAHKGHAANYKVAANKIKLLKIKKRCCKENNVAADKITFSITYSLRRLVGRILIRLNVTA